MWEPVVVGLVAIAAAWDVGRRAVAQYEAHKLLRARVDELAQQVQKEHETIQNVLAKFNAVTAATSARVPSRLGVARG